MGVAVDNDVDAVHFFSDIRGLYNGGVVNADVCQHDDDIDLLILQGFYLGASHFHGIQEGNAFGVLRIGFDFRFFRGNAENTDFDAVYIEDGLAFKVVGASVFNDVGSQNIEAFGRTFGRSRLILKVNQGLVAVVEIVVSGHHGLVAHGLHQVDDALAVFNAGQCRAVGHVPGI